MFVICQCSPPLWDREHEEVNSRLWSGKGPLTSISSSDLFMKFWGFSRVSFPAPLQGMRSLGGIFFFFFNGNNTAEWGQLHACLIILFSARSPPIWALQCSDWGHCWTPLTASFRCVEFEPNFLSSVKSHVIGGVPCLRSLLRRFLTLSLLRMKCLQACIRRTWEGRKARCCLLLGACSLVMVG